MFKRKQERSDWLCGFLLAELNIQYFTLSSALAYYIFEMDGKFRKEICNGYLDYLDHYENNLKNILG